MKVNLYNNFGELKFDENKIIIDLENEFTTRFNIDKEASLILVGLEEIQQINKEYRDKDYATDVISFEDDEDPESMGDIFICVPKIYEQALNYEHSIEREFSFLLCHGLLHLMGYDHMTTEDEKEMFGLQEEILEKNYRRK